jgi:hypothetical protein
MNRRSFLKKLTGCTLGVMGGGLVLPYGIKSELVKPFSQLISANYLDEEIRERIVEIKKDNQNMQLG